MSEIEYCEQCGYIKQQCQCEKPMTNADRIRNMSDEELAEFLVKVNGAYAKDCMVGIEVCKYDDCADMDCEDCFLEWLQAEVKEGAENG